MRYYRRITGSRLYLSPFSGDETSAAKWAEWMNDQTVTEHYGGPRNLISGAGARKTVAELGGYRFDIVLLDGDELIGHISLHDVDHLSRNAFLGVVIGGEEHRGRGYGGEAIRLVLDYGFKSLNLHSVMLTVHEDNHAGVACYKRVGFREVGRLREWIFKNGSYTDKLYMQIMEGEIREK